VIVRIGTDTGRRLLEALSIPIRRRKAFANAMSMGLAVNELAPRDPKASQELDTLVTTLETAGKHWYDHRKAP
jgi:hypothetical protein